VSATQAPTNGNVVLVRVGQMVASGGGGDDDGGAKATCRASMR
jgi:hypothetical protein